MQYLSLLKIEVATDHRQLTTDLELSSTSFRNWNDGVME